MSKIHVIAAEISKVFGIKRGKNDSDKVFTKKLHDAATNENAENADEKWEQLSSAAQDWVNAATDAAEAGNALPDFDALEKKETKKPAKASKAKAEEAEEEEESEEPAKASKTAKGKAAAKVKPDTKAKAGASQLTPTKTLSPAWKTIFKAIDKKGEDGISVRDMAALCEKNGVGLYYRRFVVGGLLKNAGRGSYAITKVGQKALVA